MLSYDLEPPTQVSVGELYIQGIERRGGGGAIFHGKGSGGTQIIRQHRDCGTLNNILYYTPFSASVVQWKENYFCLLHKTMEPGELFVVRSIQRV